MLEFTLQQFPLRFGLDEGTDPHQQPPGRLATLENGEWVKGGRIQKRSGVTAYGTAYYDGSSSGTITSAKRLFRRGGQLCLIDGSYVYGWSDQREAWQRVDQVPDAALTWRTLIDPYDGVRSSDVVAHGDWTIHAWVTGDPTANINAGTARAWVQIYNTDSGVSVLAPTAISTATDVHGVRLVTDGSHVFAIYRRAGSLYAAALSLTTLTFSATAVLSATVTTLSGFDAKIVGTDIIIAYAPSAGAITVARYTYNSGANTYTVAASGTTAAGKDSFSSIAIDGAAGEVIYVAWHSASAVETGIATVNASTMAQITAPVTLSVTSAYNVSVLRTSSTGAVVAWSDEPAVTGISLYGRITSTAISSTLVVDTNSTRGTWGSRLVSRIFAIGSRIFAFALDFPLSGATAFVGAETNLIEIETSTKGGASDYVPHRYIGKLDALIGGCSIRGTLTSAIAVGSTQAVVPVPFLGAGPQTTSNWRCGLRLATVSVGADVPADMWRAVDFGGEAYIVGGALSAYDGRTCFDYGFARAPIVASTNTAAPGAGSIGAGDYYYAIVLEYRSAAGVLHRSPAATTTAAVRAGASATTTIRFVSSSFTSKVDLATGITTSAMPILFVAHRTLANQSNYFRLTFEPNYNVAAYDVSASTQTLTDTSSDASVGGSGVALSARPLLYTTGGILDDHQPPNLVTLALHRSRLFGVAGDMRTIWYSKSFQDDLGVAPGFHPDFRIVMDRDVTALATMDEKLVIFSSDAIAYMVGDGPAANGQSSDFQGPFAVATDVGATTPRAIASTPDGVMFVSRRGIFLLTRGLETVWIGRAVQDKLAAFPNVTSAIIVPAKNQVRFTCNNDAATAHAVLVYDYVEKQWSTFRYAGGAFAIADAILHDGAYTFISTTGTRYIESSTTHLDDGAWVTMTIETAWISAAGPLAFQSVRRFALHGESVTDHALSVSVGFDRAASYEQGPQTWSANSAVTAVGPLEAAEVHIGNRRKCSSIRFKVQDAAPGVGEGAGVGTGAGVRLDTMGIEVGVKKGFQKKPATKRG